jgi:hypothetical protein
MNVEYTWWFGAGGDPEVYTEACSKEEAIERALAEGRENDWDEMTIVEARPMPLSNAIFDADDVLDRLAEKNEDAVDEDGDLRDMNATIEQKSELERALVAVLAAWRDRHKIGRAYQLDIRAEETIQVAAPPAPKETPE